jgi:ankyrin repeat protein
MPARHLPAAPSLEQLRKQAKELLRGVRAGEPAAVELVREHHPRVADGTAEPATLTLADAQLVVARHHGFPSWPRLREFLDVLARFSSSPHRQPVGGPVAGPEELADEFLRLACLTYGVTDGADDRRRPARARSLLDAHPELAAASIHTAAAVGEVAAARELLAADPSLASREGGPYGWPPLLYLAFSRLDSGRRGHSTLTVARLLLDHGADPNAGYLWDGLPQPFTALTGAFGRGRDPANQPRHPVGLELARLLLDAGADPNDAQTIENCGGYPEDNAHLELLLAYGLGHGSGGPWRERLGPAHPTPARLVEGELVRAARMGMADRVRLLLGHAAGIGIDLDAVWRGRTAHQEATLAGHGEIAELLVAAGARPSPLDPVEELEAACMRADRAAVERLLATDAMLAEQTVASRPDLIVYAAGYGRPEAVRLLATVGFDVNLHTWATALHLAAYEGHLEVVKLLEGLGADPTARVVDFKPGDPLASVEDPTPLGWARHADRHEVADYLAGLDPARA